jgi:hypothetical protein
VWWPSVMEDRRGVLLLSSDDDGEMALLELRYGRAAIHPPLPLMARRRWACGPRWIPSLRRPFESPVP